MAEFLFEIGLEEIPARMIAGAQAELLKRVVGMLERERLVLAGVEAKSFSTPRRLAVWVSEVAARQEDVVDAEGRVPGGDLGEGRAWGGGGDCGGAA
jgi:glycyl-tRNA synthetase beta chain